MDELKELRDEFSYSTILNEWVKKLNLNFKVEFLNSFINSQGSIYYQIKIVDPQTTISSELADIVILINVNEKKLSQDITNHEKNTMGLQEEMDDCTKGLLRTLFYLKAALVTVHNFMLEPKKEISSWIDRLDKKNGNNKDYVLQNIDKKFRLDIRDSFDISGLLITITTPAFYIKYLDKTYKYFYKTF